MGKATPTVTLHLDRPRVLRFDFNAMIRFEEKTGVSLLNGVNLEQMTVKQLRTLFWACLAHEDPELTEEQVGAMLHAGNLSEITIAVANAIQHSMPEAPESEGPDRPLTEGPSDG